MDSAAAEFSGRIARPAGRHVVWTDLGKIFLKVILDQIKIIAKKNDLRSDQEDHLF
jgi:hypothetical protein